MGDLKTPKFPSEINLPATKNGINLEDDWHGVKTLWFQLKGEKIKVERLRFGFCIIIFLSILSDFLSRKKLTQKWQEPKAEQCAKLQFLNNEIDQKTNFGNCQMAIFVFKVYKLFTITLLLAVVNLMSVSLVRENRRGLREKLKHKIRC